MTWYLRVKTISGSTRDEHELDFDTKADAEAALKETTGLMSTLSTDAVTIDGRLVVKANQIVSAHIYEGAY